VRPLAKRLQRLGTETAFEVLARARALEARGRSVIHLEIGEPDFDTPRTVADAGVEAIRRGETHYTPSAGVIELRAAIAAHVERTRGRKADPAHVVVTPGAKPVMFYAVMALLEEGDECITPDPGFPIYASMVAFVGAKVVPLPLRDKDDFQPDLDELRKLVTPRTKLLILNSPHNPTGSALDRGRVRAIAAFAREHDLWVLSDEIYGEIVYDIEHHSIWAELGMAERTVLLDGFSKTFAMTGWRLGYGIFPEPLVEPVTKLVTNSVSCTATFVQRAGVAALESRPREIETMLSAFRTRRDRIVGGLNAVDGISCHAPQGAFYVFPNIRRLGLSAAECSQRLLEEAGVACLPGTSFGPMGEGHLRLSYANSLQNIDEALSRIARWAGSRAEVAST
jgi:aspartate aminotransferase